MPGSSYMSTRSVTSHLYDCFYSIIQLWAVIDTRIIDYDFSQLTTIKDNSCMNFATILWDKRNHSREFLFHSWLPWDGDPFQIYSSLRRAAPQLLLSLSRCFLSARAVVGHDRTDPSVGSHSSIHSIQFSSVPFKKQK